MSHRRRCQPYTVDGVFWTPARVLGWGAREPRDECSSGARRHIRSVSETEPHSPEPIPVWALAARAGVLDRRVLDQDRIWVTRDADVLLLASLSTEHLLNVKSMLLAMATRLHLDAMLDALVAAMGRELGDCPTAEEVAFAATGSSMADLTAEEWVETTALMRGIERTLRRRSGPAGG